MWVHHRWVLHTETSGHSLVQHVYADNILAYCRDGIFEGIVWTCVALWRHILAWISQYARQCSPSSARCQCIMMRTNPWKWCTWRKGLRVDVLRHALSRIWSRNNQPRGWILSLAWCVSRGLECVGLDDSQTCPGAWWVPYWRWFPLVLICTRPSRSWVRPIRICLLGCGWRIRQWSIEE